MLGLGHQVGGQPGGVAILSDQHHLGRPGQKLNGHLASQQLLGGGDVKVTRADNLVHPRHGLGAVGQRGNGLHATHGQDSCDAGHMCGRLHQRSGAR